MLSMRSLKQLPEDPQAYLIDYFGQYRDPLWERMDEWKQEMEDIRSAIPDLQTQVELIE
jgi:hypothetical protein